MMWGYSRAHVLRRRTFVRVEGLADNVVQLTSSRVINEMVLDGGGHFSPARIDGVHTMTLLFSSHTALDRAKGKPHTHRNLLY